MCRSLAYQFIIGLPRSSTIIPIIIPTLYLWVVDTLELKRGTWVIENDTKIGFYLWTGLEIEYVHRTSVIDQFSNIIKGSCILFDYKHINSVRLDCL